MIFEGLSYNEESIPDNIIFPEFLTETRKKNEMIINTTKPLFCFNIRQILQCIQTLQNQTGKISPKMFTMDSSETRNIKFLGKDRGIFVETFGNTELKILKKVCKECIELSTFYNEYLISVYGINYLRLEIPTFCFSYSFHNGTIQQEYIDNSITLQQYLKKPNMLDFFSIFVSIVCSIENAQHHFLFTHYDFHSNNILIQRNSKNESFSFHILDSFYSIQNPLFIPKIIDFGFSSITLPNDKIYSCCDYEKGFPFGYFPIFSVGTDIFRLLVDIYQNTTNEKNIQNFCLFLFEHFYKIKINIITDPNFLRYMNTTYFNIFFSPISCFTPLELLHFINEQKHDILEILNISKYPFTISNKRVNVSYKKKEVEQFETIFHVKINQTCLKQNPLNYRYKKTLKNFKEESIDPIIPYKTLDNKKELETFLKQYEWFLSYYEDYYSTMLENNKITTLKMVQYTKLYRNLMSIKEWILLLENKDIKISNTSKQRIRKHWESLFHLF